MFGLGMSMLEMSTLEDSKSLYYFQQGSFGIHLGKLEDRFAKVSRYYGSYFEELLRRMLDLNQLTRATFSSLAVELEPY